MDVLQLELALSLRCRLDQGPRHQSFLELHHRLGLHDGPLVALTLEYALLAFILRDLWNLRLTRLGVL